MRDSPRGAFSASVKPVHRTTTGSSTSRAFVCVPDVLYAARVHHSALKSHARKAKNSCVTVRPCLD